MKADLFACIVWTRLIGLDNLCAKGGNDMIAGSVKAFSEVGIIFNQYGYDDEGNKVPEFRLALTGKALTRDEVVHYVRETFKIMGLPWPKDFSLNPW